MPVIGFLNGASPDGYAPMAAAFRQGLREAGFVEGENVAIEYRWANGHYDRLPALGRGPRSSRGRSHCRDQHSRQSRGKGRDQRQFPSSSPPAAIRCSSDWLGASTDPAATSPASTQMSLEVEPKQLELAHALVPKATIVAVLVNPTDPRSRDRDRRPTSGGDHLRAAAQCPTSKQRSEIDDAFTTFVQQRAGVLVICPEAFFNSQAERLAALAIRHSLPAIYQHGEFAAAGGLASYGSSITDPTAWPADTRAVSSRAKSQPTCQSRSPPSSN